VVKLVPRQPTTNDPRAFALEAVAAGLRFPMGLALGREGNLFVTDNQGNYNPFNELNHIVAGKRYGFINKLEQEAGVEPPVQQPAIDIPHPWTRSVNGIAFLDTPPAVRAALGGDLFGPFEGHLIGCEYDTRALIRMSLEQVGDTWQGAVYPFSTPGGTNSQSAPSADPKSGPALEASEPLEGPVVCAIAPDGDLYVGNMRDSGWGGGANTGSIVRLRPTSRLPLGIAEVCAVPDGFEVLFTGPGDLELAGRAASYAIESYRRVATPAYGGPDVDRRPEPVRRVELAADRRRARLTLDPLRPGFVYELRVHPLGLPGEPFFPAEAHYTVRRAP
jgi:hypothetical protein